MSNAAEKQPDLFLKTVEVDISDEENTGRLVRLAEVDNKINDTEAEKASRVSDFNSELKQLRKERGKLLEAIKTRREKRDIEVYQKPDERRGIMLTIRHSDGQVIDERPLTVEERNEPLPFEERTPAHKAGANDDDDGAEGKAEADEASAAAEAGEGAPGEASEEDEAATKPSAGKVVRIRASDVKKKKADRDAKAKGKAGK